MVMTENRSCGSCVPHSGHGCKGFLIKNGLFPSNGKCLTDITQYRLVQTNGGEFCCRKSYMFGMLMQASTDLNLDKSFKNVLFRFGQTVCDLVIL